MIVYENSSELYHYGVLGMKWGVRRYQNADGSPTPEGKKRASKAFAKASNKINKLNKKATKTNLKAAKLHKEALKKESKAKNEKQYQKARELQFKANKLDLKSAKLQKKAMKWEKKMGKTFSEVKIKDISPEHLEKGKKYAYMLASK